MISFAIEPIKSVFHALLNVKAFADSTAPWLCQQIAVTVTPKEGQVMVHRFEHVYGTLIVESDRMDAVLTIDGEDYGNVPRLLLLSPGRHKVFLRAANAPDKTRQVEIRWATGRV